MTVTVFVWPMFGRAPDGSRGVGHAALYVSGGCGNIYISFWPAEHSPSAGISSPGKVHFINADRLSDGVPQWASKPLVDLNERAIVEWWSHIQFDPLIDYSHKRPFQISKNREEAFQPANHTQYRLINSQCSTMVVSALSHGATPEVRKKIDNWLLTKCVNIGPLQIGRRLSFLMRSIGTVTPTDVQTLVTDIWG